MKQVCLITGVPGVGKTTLCRNLRRINPKKYQHISFGGLILNELRGANPGLTEKILRENTGQLITKDVIYRATDSLVAGMRGEKDGSEWVLVDSHAASQVDYGFLVTPDGTDYFSKVSYAAIISLFAPPDVVLARSDLIRSGRRAKVEADLVKHEQLLNCVSIVYSSISQCPLHFVEAQTSEFELANKVDSILA